MSLLLVPTARGAEHGSNGNGRGAVSVVGLGPRGPGVAHARGAAPSWPRPTISSATRRTSRGSPSGAGSAATRPDNRVEAERARLGSGPGGRRRAGGGRLLGRPRASSRWRPPCSRRWRRRQRDDVDVRVVPGPLGDAGGGGARRCAAGPRLLRALALGPAQALGGRSSGASRRPARRTWSLALYNPASRTRREQLERAREVLLRHRAGARRWWSRGPSAAPEESVSVTTLGGARRRRPWTCARCSSSARRRRGRSPARRIPRVYTPRRYPG